MQTSILIVDDDRDLCESLARLLKLEDIELAAAYDAETGLQQALSCRCDLILLDVMLPDGDGRSLLRAIRGKSDVPIIMLTALGEPSDRVAGLTEGADDYIPKPFVPEELIARIHAVLRRRLGGKGDLLIAGDLRIELPQRRVLRAQDEIALTSAEYDILLCLIRHSGECVSREDLALQALGRPLGPIDRSIDYHISNLRRKLGPQINNLERIRSIRNAGYCYTGIQHE